MPITLLSPRFSTTSRPCPHPHTKPPIPHPTPPSNPQPPPSPSPHTPPTSFSVVNNLFAATLGREALLLLTSSWSGTLVPCCNSTPRVSGTGANPSRTPQSALWAATCIPPAPIASPGVRKDRSTPGIRSG